MLGVWSIDPSHRDDHSTQNQRPIVNLIIYPKVTVDEGRVCKFCYGQTFLFHGRRMLPDRRIIRPALYWFSYSRNVICSFIYSFPCSKGSYGNDSKMNILILDNYPLLSCYLRFLWLTITKEKYDGHYFTVVPYSLIHCLRWIDHHYGIRKALIYLSRTEDPV